MASRSRYSGSASDLSDALLKHASEPAWFKYGESDKDTVNSQLLVKYSPVMRTLKSLQANLSFNKSTVTAAMKAILEKKNGEWCLNEAERLSQPEVMTKRLRAACRHAGQALGRKDPPSWVKEVFGTNDGDGEVCGDEAPVPKTTMKAMKVMKKKATESAKDKVKGSDGKDVDKGTEERRASRAASRPPKPAVAAGAGEYLFFGWDAEFGKAWRATSLDRAAEKNFAIGMVEPENPTSLMPMLAKFEDGTTHPIEEMMVSDWRARGAARSHVPAKPSGKTDILFEITYPPTNQQLVVKPRKDRLELMSLWLGKSQKLQVPLHAFKSQQAAAKLLEAIGGSYVNPTALTG
jgi:hypothetical protein